jgi:hypothetical protein
VIQKRCDRCITYKHAKYIVLPYELYTLLPVPNEPWIDISMNFVLGLLWSKQVRDSIFIIIDRFFKMIYFIHCRKINDVNDIVNLFFK